MGISRRMRIKHSLSQNTLSFYKFAYEASGRVVVEALCEGIPVIALDNGFANEIIKDWYNGFIVAHGAVNKLVRRMELFITNPNLTDSMGKIT